MKITPKHKINEVVYFMSSDKIQKGIIREIDINISEFRTDYHYQITETQDFLEEHRVFSSIKELIENLKQKHNQEYETSTL